MKPTSIKLQKDFGVLVNNAGKLVLKEFDYRTEAVTFARKLDEFENVEYEIIERAITGIEGRSTSLAFKQIPSRTAPGGYYFKVQPVEKKRGHLFCTECHDYKQFKKLPWEHGSVFNCCPDCGITTNDFNIKTANELWPVR